MFSTPVNTLEERAAFIALLARRSGGGSHDFGEQPAAARRHTPRAIVRIRGCQVLSPSRAAAAVTAPAARELQTVGFDIAALAGAFAQRLHEADSEAFTLAQAEDYAHALRQDTPRSRRSLYYMTSAIFVSADEQVATFNRVFSEVFGPPVGADRFREREPALTVARS